jgi:hypothetical protein
VVHFDRLAGNIEFPKALGALRRCRDGKPSEQRQQQSQASNKQREMFRLQRQGCQPPDSYVTSKVDSHDLSPFSTIVSYHRHHHLVETTVGSNRNALAKSPRSNAFTNRGPFG